MRVVVVGGGIGGLACAVALGRAGADVQVLERASRFTEIGAGIQLAANSFRALDVLGVADRVIASAVPVRSLEVRDGTSGEALVAFTTGDRYRAEFGFPYMVVHRRDIHNALLDVATALSNVTLTAGVAVTGFTSRDTAIIADTDGDPVATGDLLIGADGIHSTIRQQILGDGPPTLCGHTIYRSVIDLDDVPVEIRREYIELSTRGIPVTLWAGTDWHVVNYPISGGRQLNLAVTTVDGDHCAAVGEPVADAVPAAVPEDPDPRIAELLGAGRDWRRWTLADRPPATRWTAGRAVLIGDAAHPMLQYAAQGAGMALEDAVVLARTLDGPGSDTEKLERFVAARSTRSGVVRNLAVELGQQVYHTTVRAREDRNRWLAEHSDDRIRDLARWLHGATTFTETPTAAAQADRSEAS